MTELGRNHQAYHHDARQIGGLAIASWLAAQGDRNVGVDERAGKGKVNRDNEI